LKKLKEYLNILLIKGGWVESNHHSRKILEIIEEPYYENNNPFNYSKHVACGKN